MKIWLTDYSTGEHSVYTQFHGREIMFHVSTLLPWTPNNRQQVWNGFVSFILHIWWIKSPYSRWQKGHTDNYVDDNSNIDNDDDESYYEINTLQHPIHSPVMITWTSWVSWLRLILVLIFEVLFENPIFWKGFLNKDYYYYSSQNDIFIFIILLLQLLRKRHIGNDIVTIVFQEPGALPFTPKNIRSHFQHVFIVVRVFNPCSDNTYYRYFYNILFKLELRNQVALSHTF